MTGHREPHEAGTPLPAPCYPRERVRGAVDLASADARKPTSPDVSLSAQTIRRCVVCDGPIVPHEGRGRPRKYCHRCVPSGPDGRYQHGAYVAAWRRANPERVAAHNAHRRAVYHAGSGGASGLSSSPGLKPTPTADRLRANHTVHQEKQNDAR